MKNTSSVTMAAFFCLLSLNAVADTRQVVLTKVDVPDIVNTYKQNEMRFTKNYKGKSFQDSFVMGSIKQVMGSWVMYFDHVYCNLTNAQADKYASLNAGDKLLVTGTISDVTALFSEVLILENCKIKKMPN